MSVLVQVYTNIICKPGLNYSPTCHQLNCRDASEETDSIVAYYQESCSFSFPSDEQTVKRPTAVEESLAVGGATCAFSYSSLNNLPFEQREGWEIQQ